MSIFDVLIREVANKFGLAPQAAALVREVLRYITNTPGGVAGFLDKFRAAGLSALISSWVGKTDNQPLSVSQLEQSVGYDALDGIARRVGLARSATAGAIAFLVPKIIDALTPDGFVPNALPPQASAFLSGATGAAGRAVIEPERKRGIGGWLWGVLALAALLALLGYWFLGRPAEQVATKQPQVTALQATQPAPSMPPHLSLSNVDGKVRYDGMVGDEQTRTGILGALQRVFGADNISGSIAVDPKVGPADWLAKLEAALQNFKIPGGDMLFEGNSISVGGMIAQVDLDHLKQSLQSIFGGNVTVASLSDRAVVLFGEARTRTLAALNSLKPGFTGNDLVHALNLAIINFDTGSATITPESRDILQKAAAAMKSAPSGTKIEVGGHTDSTGDPATNMTLSQARADAVRVSLVDFGVDPSMLTAKGYGDTKPAASNDTPQGRFQNRRIEFVAP